MRAKDIKIRCSALGKIMTNPRAKKDTMSKTCQTYVEDLFKELEYGIVKDFSNDATEKGNRMEKSALELMNDVLELNLTSDYIDGMSQRYGYNDYVHGSTDLETDDTVYDVKTSYDGNTFPMFAVDIPTKEYYDQLQGYLWITGKSKAILAYCLLDTPEDLLQDAIRREHWKQNSFWNGDDDPAIIEQVTANHRFGHIDAKYRVKHWVIERDEERIEAFKERIELCREYYNMLLKAHNREDYIEIN
jgi:hypothetical protein